MKKPGKSRFVKLRAVPQRPKVGSHSDHSAQLVRLRRVKGQVEGIEKMIESRRYCPDIITQIRAARAALKSVEAEIFQTHIRQCVKSVMDSERPNEAELKVQDLIRLLY